MLRFITGIPLPIKYRIVYGLPLITMFVVMSGVSPIIFMSGAVTSENYWRITLQVTANIVINGSPYIILFLTWFSGIETQIKRWKLPSINRRSIVVLCDIMQRPIVTSFGSIVMRTFPSGSRMSSKHRQADYHSLIIKNYSQRFHWLACKKRCLLIKQRPRCIILGMHCV